MKQLFLILVSLTFFVTFGTAQEKVETSLLWEISGKKVKSPSYIFGTMHLIPKDDFYFPESLQEKVRQADVLVMEVGDELSGGGNMMEMMLLEDGRVLWDMFTEEQLDSIFNYAETTLGYSESQVRMTFGRMKPFFLVQLFTLTQFGEEPESYELSLTRIANENKIKIMGLESIDEQIKIIDKLNENEQVAMVMEALKGNVGAEDETRKMIDAYLSQDLDQLIGIMEGSESANSDDFQSHLLVNRNLNWIKPIKKIIKKNKAFIAVGAMHLAGENGVIELLRKEGYTLTPIKF